MAYKIDFIDTTGAVAEDYYPVPAVSELPEWYKRAESFMNNERIPNRLAGNTDSTTSTIKRCRPVGDAIGAGYLLKLSVDVNVRLTAEGAHWFEWPTGNPIEFHTASQAPGYPGQEKRKFDYPKFMNPWSIRTPRGYSTMFLPPAHRALPFRVLEGIVDTDEYINPVHLPFIFIEDSFEGLLTAGTPIAQVIPFERNDWKMSARVANPKDKEALRSLRNYLHSRFFGGYASKFWHRKQYR